MFTLDPDPVLKWIRQGSDIYHVCYLLSVSDVKAEIGLKNEKHKS